ncbi:hypothetical protein RhiirC2_795572, partial [Rhizophagus irregularis]
LAKQLLKPKVPPPPTQELVDQSDLEKFCCGLLVQGSDSVEEYYSKIKRCNEIIKYGEDYLWHKFIKGLKPENNICIGNIKLRDELVEGLFRALRTKDRPDQSGAVITMCSKEDLAQISAQ